jgi:predicted TIM-barrel fold metal-dependent hydrolase
MTELIHDFGTDRVLLGSGYPWEDPSRAVDIIKSLELSERRYIHSSGKWSRTFGIEK